MIGAPGAVAHDARDGGSLFLVLRFTGMRRESVSSLRVRNLASGSGLRGVVVKGGKTRDIPLPDVVVQVLNINEIELVAPTGFEPVFGHGRVFATLNRRIREGKLDKTRRDLNTW
jgi:integrase